ncbi:MAG TPA: hypothetical protein VM509_11745 [Planctomycetota bacterium]|nr:hypothetical protein [Planctomycetota bacterium]
METKQIEVVCPCCSNRLTIDLRTEKVMRARPKEQVDETGKPKVGEEDWTQAFGKVKDRETQRDDRLGSMLDQERRRGDDLEERFRAAKKKLDEAE